MRKQQQDSSKNSDQQQKQPGKPVLNQETKCNTHENAARTSRTKLFKIPNSNHFSLDRPETISEIENFGNQIRAQWNSSQFLAVSVFLF